VIGFPEAGQACDRFGFRIDRLSAALWVSAPVRDQAPAQEIKRSLASFVVLANDEKFLAGRAIPASWIIQQATIANIEPIDNRVS
jgi:hypothetical protein